MPSQVDQNYLDVDGILNEAKKFIESSSSQDKEYQYQIVYPGEGTTKFKLLYNRKSKTIFREIRRHQFDKMKLPCLRMYDMNCPICEQLTTIKGLSGSNRHESDSKLRYISMAYLLPDSSGTTADPNKIVILMYPYTVYTQLQNIISEITHASDIYKFVAQNDSFSFSIKRQNNKYTTVVNAVDTRPIYNTDKEYDDAMNSLESLNDQIVSSDLSSDMLNKVNVAADQLYQEFVAPQVSNESYEGSVNNEVSNVGTYRSSTTEEDQTTSSSVFSDSRSDTTDYHNVESTNTDKLRFQSMSTNDSNPKCFGKSHVSGDPQCMECPQEFQCSKSMN